MPIEDYGRIMSGMAGLVSSPFRAFQDAKYAAAENQRADAMTEEARRRTDIDQQLADTFSQSLQDQRLSTQTENEARSLLLAGRTGDPQARIYALKLVASKAPAELQQALANQDPEKAWPHIEAALAKQLGETLPPPPPVQPTFVNDRSGYSYGWDPTQGVLPGSMQTPQRALQTGPTPDMQNWGFRSRLPPDQRADWDAQHGAGSGGAYRDMTPAEVTAVGLPAGTLAQRTAAGKIDVVNKPKGADLAPKDVTTIKTKLANISTAKRQLQLVKNKFAEMKDTMATGPGSAWAMPLSEKGQQFDSAVDSMRDSITSITRVPGIGSQSDWEGRLTQAKMPSRNKYESVTAQQIQSLEDLLNGLDSGYADMLSSDGVAPAAPNPGDNVRGFIFIGGDPGDKKNWTLDRSKR